MSLFVIIHIYSYLENVHIELLYVILKFNIDKPWYFYHVINLPCVNFIKNTTVYHDLSKGKLITVYRCKNNIYHNKPCSNCHMVNRIILRNDN